MTEHDPALVELVARALHAAHRVDDTFDLPGPHWELRRESYRDDARTMLSALTAAGYQVLPPGGETRTEWGIWWHADDPDGIVLSEEMIGRRERAEARAKERIGDYGITGYTIVRSEHRVWPDGATLIGPWQPDTDD